jgi:CHAT domain-containing protein
MALGQRTAWFSVLAMASALAGAPPPAAAQPGPPRRASANESATPSPEQEARLLAETRARLVDAGRYVEAIPVTERLLARKEQLLGPAHRETLTLVRYLAWLYHQIGDYPRAEHLYQRAATALEQTLGTGHVDTLYALASLAGVYKDRGDYAHAEPRYQRLLALAEQHGGPEGSSVPDALFDLANLYRDMGEPARAEPLLVRALGIVEKRREPVLISVTVTDVNSRKEAVHDTTPVDVFRGQTRLLGNLALVYQAMGQLARAEPLFLRALALDERSLGAAHPNVAVDLEHLAVLYQAMGQLARAEPLLERSLALREKHFGKAHPRVAVTLHDWARLCLAEGNGARAEAFARRALAVLEKAHGPEHPHVADTLFDLTDALAAQGRVAEAIPLAERAAAIQDRAAALVLAVGSEAHKRAFMVAHRKRTDALVSLHARSAPLDPAAMRLGLTTVLRRKGRVLDAMTEGFAALRGHLDSESRALFDQLGAVAARIAALASRDRDEEKAPLGREEQEQLEVARQRLEAEIGRRSAEFRAEQGLVTIEQVARALPEGAALVEIVAYRPVEWKAKASDRWGEPRYAAYVLTGRGGVAFVDLGQAAPLDAEAARLRRALADPNLRHDPRPVARALDARLMEPVRKALGSARRIFISPDGVLGLLPFGALVDEGGRYLVERYLFTYMTSGRELVRLEARAAPPQRALVVADPAFGPLWATPPGGNTRRGLGSVKLSQVGFTAMPDSRAEARAVERAIPGARVLVGESATEGAIKATHGPSVLHVATHGFFLPAAEGEPPRGSGLDASEAERAAALRSESPLLRSGIALAGANRRESGRDDGILTALEASALDLYGTRLVVLSACETGVGDVTSWEGVYGLRRAFSMAGAETQVMSLWPVDTEATRDLMMLYYEHLKEGAGRSAAMRAVELTMLATPRTAHPNLWASFIVSGNPRALDGSVGTSPLAKVVPGPRGCSCGLADREGGARAALALGALSLGLSARRRRPRLRGKARRAGDP